MAQIGRLVRWVVVAAVLAGAGVAAWSYFTPKAKVVQPTTTAVTRTTIEESVLASGTIEASQLVSVGAEVSGSIKTLKVVLGDAVQTGDLIAEIDSLNQENAVRASEAALAGIEAQKRMQTASLAKARVALERAEKLFPQQLISDAELQTAQLAVETAQGQLEALEAQIQQAEISVDTAKLNLGRTRIVAPMDGTVVSLEVEVGQTVNAVNSTPTIVKLANLDQMVVKAEISEADVPRVEAGQKVYFTILGDPDTRIEATLRAIEPAPESISGEQGGSTSAGSAIYYNGLFDVANPDHRLRISMTAQVTIVLASAENVLAVPASVLKTGGRSTTVEVWDAASKSSEMRPVEVGLTNNVMAEIKSGLQEGDLIVVSGGTGSSAAPSGNSTRGLLAGGGPVGGPPL
ncbi:efflux RND transporter periplasmic adaptor subunit [Devosia sp.]|uniref:efflux RND transporter periplasmic adaptor subunit n=1 Tax=Devosia sp. TaxID=1871048 RepID=UPI0035AF0FAC